METTKYALWQVAELRNIQLVETHSFTSWTAEEMSEKAPLLKIKHSEKPVRHPGSNSLEVLVDFEISELLDAKRKSAPPGMFIRAQFRALYLYPEGYKPNRKDILDFAGRNAPLNLWPYWRELVQSLANRMCLPLGPLPLYRAQPPLATRELHDPDKIAALQKALKEKHGKH